MVAAAMFSSATEEWSTPQDLYDALNAEFGFMLDAAADHHNAKCKRYYHKRADSLAQDWVYDLGQEFGGDVRSLERCAVWLNPPYGRTIARWVAKAFEEAGKGLTVVCLLPSRTDTKWWHSYVQPVLDRVTPGEVRFLKGRLKFGGAKNSAPFPSVIVVFRPRGVANAT